MEGHVGFTDGKRGRSYYYKFSIVNAKGKRNYITKRGFKSEAEARKAMTIAMAEYLTGNAPISREKTTLIEHTRKWLSERKLRRTTLCGYRNIVEKHIANDPISRKLVSEIRYDDLNSYYARRRKDGLKENTLKRHHAILRKVLKEAVKNGLLVSNPADLVEFEKIEEYEAQTYNSDQVVLMLDVLMDDEIYPCVLLAMEMAERRGEVLGTTWNQVNLDQKTLNINKAYYVVDGIPDYDPVKTKKSHSTLYLTNLAANELKRIRKEQIKMKLQLGPNYNDNNLVCCRLDGRPWNPSTVSKRFSKLLKKHGLPHIRFHDLRHSHATILAESGADIRQIAAQLRHATVQMANRYVHADDEARRQMAKRYEKAVRGQKKTSRRHQEAET